MLDSNFDLDSVRKLTFELQTFLGDADLFISDLSEVRYPTATQHTFASRQNDRFDQITITDSVNTWLSSNYYIAIFGELYSEFEFTVQVEYHPVRNEKLLDAVHLQEGISVHHEFKSQYEYAFYAFSPWWSSHEQRTLVMLADSPQ